MPVTYLIKFDVLPEHRARFIALLDEVIDAMRHEPMFHEAALSVDPDSENRLMLHETWEDHDDVLNVQMHRPYRRAYHRRWLRSWRSHATFRSGARCAPTADRSYRISRGA